MAVMDTQGGDTPVPTRSFGLPPKMAVMDTKEGDTPVPTRSFGLPPKMDVTDTQEGDTSVPTYSLGLPPEISVMDTQLYPEGYFDPNELIICDRKRTNREDGRYHLMETAVYQKPPSPSPKKKWAKVEIPVNIKTARAERNATLQKLRRLRAKNDKLNTLPTLPTGVEEKSGRCEIHENFDRTVRRLVW
jgi:hypothetical protein